MTAPLHISTPFTILTVLLLFRSLFQFNEHFLKKIPPGAEASNILVGEVDFLNHPIIAFLRLGKAMLLGDLTEVRQLVSLLNFWSWSFVSPDKMQK